MPQAILPSTGRAGYYGLKVARGEGLSLNSAITSNRILQGGINAACGCSARVNYLQRNIVCVCSRTGSKLLGA
jgi:hypothetical protein